MANEVVRYHNGLNQYGLRGFTPVEMDLFWAVCSKMKNKGTQVSTFNFSFFKEIINSNERGPKFYDPLKSLADKLLRLNYVYEDEDVFDMIMLFQQFRVEKKAKTVTIQVSSRFEFVLNQIGDNFTRFELENMTRLKSSYTKELYRHLMQFKNKDKKGVWHVRMDDFREKLAIPDSYRMSDIDSRILKKAKKELCTAEAGERPIFTKLRWEKEKDKGSNKIQRIHIYFEELKGVSLHNWLEGDD